ncbi:MAG: hypothetical protein ACOYOS_21430 [Syntrophales bacterium]
MDKGCYSELKDFLADGRPRTVEELTGRFGFSRTTAFRKLKRCGALTSINCDGCHYILPPPGGFNRYGLVSVEGKVFFRGGNLLKAVAHLVDVSRAGMTASELGALVGSNVQMQLLDLTGKGKLWRKRDGGYCYFSADESRRSIQMEARNPSEKGVGLPERLKGETPESMRQIVMIVLAYLANPRFSPKGVALSLIRRGVDIRTEKVKAVFEKYGIAKKNWPRSC